MPDKLLIRNPSVSADIRVLAQNELHKTDEFGNTLGYEWNPPTAENCISPAATGSVILNEKRRIVLETSSADDLLIPVTNDGHHNTLRVSRLSKKTGDITPLGFVGPLRNGQHADPIIGTLNSKFSILVQQLPK
jgi:hypothetical protein